MNQAMAGRRFTEEFISRFWSKVDVSGDSECWIWSGAKGKYGNVKLRGKVLNSHRVAYELSIGRILPGFVVCHQCGNKLCCNPRHLKLGSYSDNLRDAYRMKEREPRS